MVTHLPFFLTHTIPFHDTSCRKPILQFQITKWQYELSFTVVHYHFRRCVRINVLVKCKKSIQIQKFMCQRCRLCNIIFYNIKSFIKTTATLLVRPRLFSTLCTTPIGKMTVWRLSTEVPASLHVQLYCILYEKI